MKNNRDNYGAWKIDIDGIPRDATLSEKIKFFLKLGILAPSTHNTQPWLFKIDHDYVDVIPNWKYKLRFSDPTNRNLFISLGCCIKNIECIASYYGLDCSISVAENNLTSYIRLKFRENNVRDKRLADLAKFLTSRYSNKLEYLSKKIPNLVLDNLRKISQISGITIQCEDSEDVISKIAIIQKKSIISLANNKQFRNELSQWLRPNMTKKYDGMPGFVAGLNPFQSLLGKIIIRLFPFSFKILAKKDYELILKSPLVGVISSRTDKVTDWINVGRVYEELCLYCCSLGINISPMHAMIEDKKYSGDLNNLMDVNGHPRMFFRMGYTSSLEYHTPRRNLDESIVAANKLNFESKLAHGLGVEFLIKQITIGKFKINYLTAGSGKPLLLIHGGNIGWGQWYPNIANLSKSFKVYAIDLPGAGRSSRINYRDLSLKKDLVGIVEEFIRLLHINNVHIVGSSIGGWIALKLALKIPQKLGKLVLVDSLGFTSYMGFSDKVIGFYPLAYLLSRTVLRPDRSNKKIEHFLRSVFYDKNVVISNDFVDYFYETMRASHNLLFISRLSSIFGVRPEFIMRDKLSKITNKTLIIWGEKDSLMPLDKNSDDFYKIKNVSVKVIKNAGHIPSIEKSVEFNKLVSHFLLG